MFAPACLNFSSCSRWSEVREVVSWWKEFFFFIQGRTYLCATLFSPPWQRKVIVGAEYIFAAWNWKWWTYTLCFSRGTFENRPKMFIYSRISIIGVQTVLGSAAGVT